MSFIKKKYDRNYFENTFFKSRSNSQRNRKRISEILRYKNKGKLIEIGCAKGEFLDIAKDHFDIYGIDISEYAISNAKKKFNKKVYSGDIRKIKLKENQYDVVVGFNILEHMKDSRKVIENVYSSLKDKGIFIGSVPNKSLIIGRAFTIFSNFADRTHCSTFTPKIWKKIFQQSGFEKINFFGEIMPTTNHCLYIKGRLWSLFSMNLVFICIK